MKGSSFANPIISKRRRRRSECKTLPVCQTYVGFIPTAACASTSQMERKSSANLHSKGPPLLRSPTAPLASPMAAGAARKTHRRSPMRSREFKNRKAQTRGEEEVECACLLALCFCSPPPQFIQGEVIPTDGGQGDSACSSRGLLLAPQGGTIMLASQ